jgi:hypothetical protein
MVGVISDDMLHHGCLIHFGAVTNNADKEVTFVLWEGVFLEVKTPEGVDPKTKVLDHGFLAFNVLSTQFALIHALPARRRSKNCDLKASVIYVLA